MNDLGLYWQLDVMPPTYTWSYAGQAMYTDSSKATPTNNWAVSNEQSYFVMVRARNSGNTTWTNTGPNPVRLGTTNPQDRSSIFCDASWLSCTRPATLKEANVGPGDIGTFEFTVKAPYSTNSITANERFNLVSEGRTWMNDIGLNLPFTFNSPLTTWQYINQGVYTSSNLSQSVSPSSLAKNTTYYLALAAKNTSGGTWQKTITNLGTYNPQDRTSVFCTTGWLSCNRSATVSDNVIPGATGTFIFPIKTPSINGNYKEYFRPLNEGQAWLTDVGLYWDLTVN
jgi:hypothetical protein